MPTSSKRQRQKTGRQARQQAVRAYRRRQARQRGFVTAVIIALLVGVIIAVVNPFSTSSSKKTISSAADVACPKADGSSPRKTTFSKAPPNCIDANKNYTAKMTTSQGAMTITLDAKQAPKTVNNFVFLARYHFFDGLTFHRVVPGFVIQGGDPQGTGQGGPGYKFADELPKANQYKIGSLAMANSGPNTNGSQFFIITGDQGVNLPPQYSLFGQVTDGMDVVKKIDALGDPNAPTGAPKEKITIDSVTITQS